MSLDSQPQKIEDLLSKSQQQVISAFEAGENIFVTGSAGSGKSFLLNYLKQNYGSLGLHITASTGIAAVNVGGSTIHSWAGIGLANLPIEQILENIFSAKMSKVRRKIINARALAIDEISMISAKTLEIIDQVFRHVRQFDKPMGGLQILFFGDFLQLPPVQGFGEEFKFCFESDVWQELNLNSFNLQEIFRQKDEKFIRILNNLRLGQLEEEDLNALQARVGAVDNNSLIKPTILTTHNHKVEQINLSELQKIPSLEQVFEAKYFGDLNKVEMLKKNCLAYQNLRLKVGAQVMMIKNTYQKEGIINGSIGVVRDFSPKKSYPIVEFANKKIITIAPEEWVIEKYDDEKKLVLVEGGMIQIPLILAWGITIHKSQGLTLDKISCDLSDVFSPGQAYVALSRARSLESIFISKINFSRINSHSKALEFYQNKF